MKPEMLPIATRLCAACGMCCNGVLFQSVVLQAEDSPRQLGALGLKVKRRSNGLSFAQPCPAHDESRCTIYESRPTRCRLFVCRQLLSLEAGETTEAAVLHRIREATQRTTRVRNLLRQAGDTRETKALATRYVGVFTEPLDPSPDATALRDELASAMQDLERQLAEDFRVEQISPS